MPSSAHHTIRPQRFGYVTGGLVLLLDALVVTIIPRAVHGPTAAALAALIVAAIGLYGLNDVLVAGVARIVVDDTDIEVRNQLGRRRRFARADVGHVASKSVFAPAERGIYQQELTLVARDGHPMARISGADYGPADLERMVKILGLEWPRTMTSRVRPVSRKFPGAQAAVVGILVIFAAGLGAIALALLTH